MGPLKYFSVCSGIEAVTVAWVHLGWTPIAFAEIEKFTSAVLAYHYPDVENLGDMTEIDLDKLRHAGINLVVGGTPCQAFSIAGQRKSLGDDRGNLTLKFVDICNAINPKWIVWENVPGVLNTKDNAFGYFLAGLAGENEPLLPPGKKWTNFGYIAGPKRRMCWRVLDAQYFGVAQRRRRVFVVACPGDGADPREVLSQPQGVQRHTPPRRETREDVAHAFETGPGGTRFIDIAPTLDARCKDEPVRNQIDMAVYGGGKTSGPRTVAATLAAHGNRQDFDVENFVADVSPAVSTGAPFSKTGNERVETEALISHAMKVRRLSVRECERLQGFPDDYTLIPWRGKPAAGCPDGPRYKALGNSMAVPVMRWIGEGIDIVEEKNV